MLLTVLMPVYNEEETVKRIIGKVLAVPLELELIIINNGSTDRTSEILEHFAGNPKVKIISKDVNIGKGDGVVSGLKVAGGKYTVIQDGDLEYDPNDFVKMAELAEKKNAVAVFGSRRLNPSSGISYNRYLWGGEFLTILANLLFGVGITDEATCYKMVRTDILRQLNLQCRRFEFCPEVVAKLGRNGIRIYEVPIAYYPRKFEEGKKIRWYDGIEAIWTLLKYRLQPLKRFRIKK